MKRKATDTSLGGGGVTHCYRIVYLDRQGDEKEKTIHAKNLDEASAALHA